MISEEKDGEFYINMPSCTNCDKPMRGFFYKFYKSPNFNESEVLAAFFWTDVYFVCGKCHSKQNLSKQEIDTMNTYSLDRINFPPGTDSKNMKIQKLHQ